MLNYYYKDSIQSFIQRSENEIIGSITSANQFDTSYSQSKSWKSQVPLLKEVLKDYSGTIFFEFSIPRMGKRIDVLLIIKNIVFVIEFKVGAEKYYNYYIDQVWDYALDLKNFHEPSHNAILVPVLVSTEAQKSTIDIISSVHNDNLVFPLRVNDEDLHLAIQNTVTFLSRDHSIDGNYYAAGSYKPTPTIVEAAISLYRNHTVDEITRSDATAKNLSQTTSSISHIIEVAKKLQKKIICFVTGVPGAGKTLVGLKIATQELGSKKDTVSVYLSGNGPLVIVLQEALARDKVQNERESGNRISKKEAKSKVKAFIQNIHHYRDAYLVDQKAPYDHVAIFDEAQRAWDKEQTIKFMKTRKGISNFSLSEPGFLISCLDRHKDWAVIICLVGGGQEINTGEAGIEEWLYAIKNHFPHWEISLSPNLTHTENEVQEAISELKKTTTVIYNSDLHLGVSMRSFRAEHLSLFVEQLLDLRNQEAKETLSQLRAKYPIVLTRDLNKAKDWLRTMARGSERYGMVVSSQAYRLKPYAIDVKSPMDPVHWFLNNKDDIRSSYYLEDVATEFQIQGLELDWACVVWDGDLRYSSKGWNTYTFKGNKWQNINKNSRKRYLVNAYRVLLTRARQGFVIVVPEGDKSDITRDPQFYNSTYKYLESMNIEVLR